MAGFDNKKHPKSRKYKIPDPVSGAGSAESGAMRAVRKEAAHVPKPRKAQHDKGKSDLAGAVSAARKNSSSVSSAERKPTVKHRAVRAADATKEQLETRKSRPSVQTAKPKHPSKRPAVKTSSHAASVEPRRSAVKRAASASESNTQGTIKLGKKGSLASAPKARTASEGEQFASFFKRHIKIMGPVAALIVIVLGMGISDVVTSWGKIHTGVTMQGVDVGGLTKEEASAKLVEELSPVLSDAKVTIYESGEIAEIDDRSIDDNTNSELAYAAESSGRDANGDGVADKWNITAETVGAVIDGDDLANQAYQVGRQGNFVGERMSASFGGIALRATISFNQEFTNTLITEINKEIGTKVKNSRAKIADGVAELSEGRDGILVDEDMLMKKISASVFNEEAPYCTIPMKTVQRDISDETAQRVVDQINEAISTDITLVYQDETWTLDSSDLGDLIGQKVLSKDEVLVIGSGTQRVESSSAAKAEYDTKAGTDEQSGSILQAYVDQKKFDKKLVKLLGDKATGGATNARFRIKKGKVSIKPSTTGTGPDRQGTELQLQKVLFGDESSNRTITMTDTTIEPEVTTEDAEAMGIKDKLASWSIPLSGTASRIKNIKQLCKLINNSLVKPGDTWSFNGTTGERTAEKGFATAPVIVNGRHEDQLGGGICQVATCVFNAACYSGLGIGTRANHAFYIPAYDDKGFADATVSWTEPDFQWVNDTENYILLTATAEEGGDVTVTLWGTDEGREITCDRGEWKEGEKYKTIRENDDTLAKGETKVEQTGENGRSIYIRYIAKSKDGEVLHDINFHSVYSAQNEIIKVGTKTSDSNSDSKDDSKSDSSES